MHVGEAISRFRTRIHLTQAGVARAAGITRQHLSLVERGERAPSPSCLENIAEVLGVPAGLLLWLAGDKPEGLPGQMSDLYDTMDRLAEEMFEGLLVEHG